MKFTSRLLIVIGILLLPLVLLSGGLVAAGMNNNPPVQSAGSTPFLPKPPQPPEGEGPWVVRAYYTDRQMVNELAAYLEPWEVHHDQGYLVVDANRDEYQRMLAAGFRLEIDQGLTDQLNQPNLLLPGQLAGIPGYPCYRTVEETYTSAQSIADSYPNLAAWTDIGDTWEKTTPGGEPGYDMYVLRLTNTLITGSKPKLFLMSSIHAREYAPAEFNIRLAEYLVSNYDIDPDVTWLLDHHEIHFLFHANPDGRKWAESGYSWRKNTDNNFCSNTTSRGVDLNRNFEFQWNCCGGSSSQPCNNLYRGPGPGSEPETLAIQNYVRSQFPDQRADPLSEPAPPDATGVFIDIHSYGKLVLWPWGFTGSAPPNSGGLQTLGRKFAYFNGYEPKQGIELYPMDGATDDFAYGELGLAAYTIELGTTFFQSCGFFESTILPKNLPTFLYAAKVARTPYLTPSGPDALNLSVSPAEVPQGVPAQLTATINDTRYNNSHGTEPTQNIVAAEYYIDAPPWDDLTPPVATPLTPVDGNFDAKIEEVAAAIDTTDLSPGRHTIFVRGRDALGNWGPISAVFMTVTATSPTAEFSSTSPAIVGQPVYFTNLTTGTPPFTYTWDFGDGIGSDIVSDPIYTYHITGTFTVSLTATNSLGSDSVIHPVYIWTEEDMRRVYLPLNTK